MSAILLILMLIVLVAIIGTTAFAIAMVRSSRKQRAADADMPFPSRAPERWAVTHEPEAKLHRRLRDAVRALQGNQAMLGAVQLDEQVQITVVAQDLDDQLVTVSALPEPGKAEAIARLQAQVADVERRVGVVLTPPAAGPTVPGPALAPPQPPQFPIQQPPIQQPPVQEHPNMQQPRREPPTHS